ncbi:MAG: hypothetical protein A2077_07110 [Nitrospirae bacterium GWC2_46_6]|nr:MAG: hypothetical protein A2077_07110 [Nitrospirae bacterium GWC2_46_6]
MPLIFPDTENAFFRFFSLSSPPTSVCGSVSLVFLSAFCIRGTLNFFERRAAIAAVWLNSLCLRPLWCMGTGTIPSTSGRGSSESKRPSGFDNLFTPLNLRRWMASFNAPS